MASSLSRAFTIMATLTLCTGVNIKDIGATTVDEVNFEIAEELAGHIPAQRIAGLEAVLDSVYKTLPKNAYGRVGHQTVRYALHRLFVKRHGWYIKGLEPGSTGASPGNAAWIPSYLQDKVEEHLGNYGMDLHELASLGAALEDLIRKEAGKGMNDVYQVLKMPTTQPVSMKAASDALDTYAMAYLLSGNTMNITLVGPKDSEKKRNIFAQNYRNFSEFHSWFEALEQRHLDLSKPAATVDFATMSRLAEDFGERYGAFNDGECRALKTAMLAVEGKGSGEGRVRLSDFYNMSRYSHWKLHEKADYLRDLGALDETNRSNLMVIVPNYITSRPNCLEATPLYAICCRDECEDLIGRLERDLQDPKAPADKIAKLVATYSSDTVRAPRQLSTVLITRLQEIADLHGGAVDLHSRLFAQWMHHAFPRECPYPHESGSIAPQTADEWMKINGHESTHSEDAIQGILDGACSASMSEDGDLPWNPVEEHLDNHMQRGTSTLTCVVAIILLLVGGTGLFFAKYDHSRGSSADGKQSLAVVSVLLLTVGAIMLDLVDKFLVLAVVGVGFGLNALSSMSSPASMKKEAQKAVFLQDKLV